MSHRDCKAPERERRDDDDPDHCCGGGSDASCKCACHGVRLSGFVADVKDGKLHLQVVEKRRCPLVEIPVSPEQCAALESMRGRLVSLTIEGPAEMQGAEAVPC